MYHPGLTPSRSTGTMFPDRNQRGVFNTDYNKVPLNTSVTQSPIRGAYNSLYPGDQSIYRVNMNRDPVVAPSPSASVRRTAPVVRVFNIVVTDGNGGRWYERDVSCSNARDLIGILQSRIGVAIPELLHQGQLFTDEHFLFVPDELKLEIGGLRTYSQPKVLTLLVEDAPRRITVEAGSVGDLYSRLSEQGANGEIQVKTPNGHYEPLRSLDDLPYEAQIRVLGGNTSNLLGDRTNSPRYPHRDMNPSNLLNRTVSRSASFTPVPGGMTTVNDPVNIQRIVVEAGHLLMNAMYGASEETVATATARIAQQFKQTYASSEVGREPTTAELAYLRSIVDQFITLNGHNKTQAQVHQSPSAAGSSVGTVNGGVFKNFNFGVAGVFPILDPSLQTDTLTIATASPPTTGKPVILIIEAAPNTQPIEARLIFGHENEEGKVIVINLEEFYVNKWMTIGKTSLTSLFVSFQPDVLRAGVRYFMDVSGFATDTNLPVGSAQTEFMLIDENGPPSRRSSNGEGKSNNSTPIVAPHSHQPDRTATAAVEPILGNQNPRFQNQLREFVETKILPLRRLQPNPKYTENEFRSMVSDACHDLWTNNPDEDLSEAHKHLVIRRVKDMI
eukprot:TRINITY_DN7741_c0_g1_i1.p1 TRINITY_DN7741_c0_g1~~TRINITY_DN7741_c0_g1_i1.p1  ORF type:complete len:615 (+),score=71.20 TRINITY_DN7741_c0_g1_i1:581-2425(+)